MIPVALKADPQEEPLNLQDDFLQKILSADESAVSIPLPGGGTASGRVSTIQRDDQGVLLVQGNVTAPEAGKFMFQRQTVAGKAGAMVGFIHYDQSDVAYQVRPVGINGKPALVKTTADEVICRAYAAEEVPEEAPQTHPTNYPIPPDENGIIQLQSLPGATAVIYLDFDGEERDFASWGYINALPAGASNTQIFDVWKGVCEDFQPFNINVTTVRGVYDAAPTAHRIQVVITPTTTASPGAGGVAYVGSFNWSSDMVCWSFVLTGKNAVEAISHEVGHTLGLSHDGRNTPSETYYSGHNGWASIMGVGYYQALSQWSKGEYPSANNTQDDLSIIVSNNNSVGYRTDDHGASFASASYLDITAAGVVSNEGTIETTTDEDSFRFSTGGGTINFNIDNVTFNPDLDLKAVILNSVGTVIATHDPAGSLDALFSGLNLAAGDYFLRISGIGAGDLTTGYSDYASLGAYTVAGNVTGGVHADRLTIAENSANGAVLGAIAARTNHGAGVLSFAIESGNTGGTFAINPTTGSLTVANHLMLDFETLSTRWENPATFELFVTITDSLGIASESLRTVVNVSDVNESPAFPAPAAVTVAENLSAGTKITTVEATDPDRSDFVTYSIVAGNTGNVFAVNTTTGVITAAGALDFETVPVFMLTLRATDHLTPSNSVDAMLTIQLLDISETYAPGTIIRTFFNGIAGSTVASLTGNARFPTQPNSEAILTSFDSGTAKGETYGSTVRGYVIAPVTGSYTFWICSDDASELRISPDANPVSAVVRASLSSWANPLEWDKTFNQQSIPISLTAGQAYYIEARHKEDTGTDHVQVAWQGPGMASKEIIPGRWLAPYQQDYTPWAFTVTSTVVRESADIGQRVGQATFVEPDLGQAVSGYAITAGNSAGIFAINSFSGEITVASSSGLVAGDTHVLTVSATDTGSPAMVGSTSVTLQVLGLNDQLHAWWKLDESSGTIVSDSSPNGRHATLAGGGSWISRDAANQALQLNGTNARFDYLGNNSLSGDSSFSVAAWVKVPATHSIDGILIQQREAGSTGHIGRYVVNMKADGRVNFSIYGKDANNAYEAYQFDITSSIAIKDGAWHHVACVRDGTTGRVFIDGVQRASSSGIIRMLDPVLTVAVGCDARDNITFFDGAVDDVRIYADALGSQQLVRVAAMPKVAIISPVADSAVIPPGVGLVLQSAASVPGGGAPVFSWSKVSGPGTATFGAPAAADTTVEFSVPGSYVLRVTATNGANVATDDLTVLAGCTAVSPFAGTTYGGGAAGSHSPASGSSLFTLTGASSGINLNGTSDTFYLLGQVFSGDFDLKARVTSLTDIAGTTAERAGLIVRLGNSGALNALSAFIGSGTGSKDLWVRRTATGIGNTLSEYSPNTLPRWCRMTRVGTTVQFWHSGDGSAWTLRGSMLFGGEVHAGLCWSSGNSSSSGSAAFDNVSGFSSSNLGPLVNAGPDATAGVAISSGLMGSVGDDGLPNPPAATAVSWSVVSGPGGIALGNANQAATTAICAATGAYVLRLTADDGAIKTFDEITLNAVLVNTIDVAASDPAAAETGPDTGTFTFTRGGSLVGNLTVNYTLSGSAANGVDYAALSGSLIIPGGTTTATLTVAPESDVLVEGPETVALTITPGTYDIFSGSAEVTIADSNHAPLWASSPIVGAAGEENAGYSGPSPAIHASDPDGNALFFGKTSGPAWLLVAADGSLSGTPGTGDIGPNTFGIRIADPGGLFADAVLEILVHFANQPPQFVGAPVVAADAVDQVPYTGQSLASFATDPNLNQGDLLAFTKLGGPTWLVVAPDGSLSGTPSAGDLGSNLFSVRVTDVAGAFADIALQINVTPTILYLDTNGPAAGSGAPGNVIWDSSTIWSVEPDGVTTTLPWINGAHAILAAGNDASVTAVTVSGSHSLSSLTVEEGNPTLAGGCLVLAEAATGFIITGTTEVGSELAGAGMGLAKSGSGTLVLAGNHSYTGGTSVTAGNLRLTGSLAATSGVVVGANGTLSGDGSVAGPVTVSGTLAPGNDVGTLTTGALSLATGARLEWQASDWSGAAGIGSDRILSTALDLTTTPAATVVLKAEALVNFTEGPATFTLVQTVSGITGFDAGVFVIDSSGFPGVTGSWQIRQSGDNLVIDYTPLAPFEAWQLAEFDEEADNPLLAGETADPDGDGLVNLLEYSLGSDPNQTGLSGISYDLENVSGTDFNRLTVARNPAATDVTFSVQTTGNLADPQSWTSADTFIEENTSTQLVVRDTLTGQRRFIRLSVSR